MGIYLVMKNNFKRGFQHKRLFLLTFLLPVIVCALFGLVRFDKTTVRVGILEASVLKLEDHEALYDIFDASKGITYAHADEESINTDLITGKYHVLLDYRNSKNLEDYQLITYEKEAKGEWINTVFKKAFEDREPVILENPKKQGLSTTERSMALLMSLFMIFSTLHASAMIRDRQNGTYLRYQYANKSGVGYILGYILHNVVITYAQVLLCMGSLLILQKNFSLTVMEILVLSSIVTGIASIFAVVICMTSKSEVQANISASAIASIMSLLGGTFVAVEAMPGLLRILSLISPIHWVVELIRIF